MFKIIGILVWLYTFYAVASGQVYVKSGIWGKRIFRQDSPKYFWFMIFVYAALGTMLLIITC